MDIIDAIDFRLLAALHHDALQSHAKLGRLVGLTAPAVRARLQRLTEAGVLQGFRTSIDPSIVGRRGCLWVLAGPFDERQARALCELDGVVWVAWKTDGGATVQTFAERPEALESQFATHGVVTRILDEVAAYPALTRSQWTVLRALVDAPRAGRQELVAATGLTGKTAIKHRDALLAGPISILPRLGLLSGAGAAVFHLAVFGNASPAAVQGALPGAVLVNRLSHTQYWFCRADDLPGVGAQERAVRDVAGVTEVRVTLNRAHFDATDRLIGWVDEQIALSQTLK